jgi:hypothetical protein
LNIHELQAEKLWSSSTNTDEIQVNCEYTTNYKLKSCEAVLQILTKYK